MENILIEFRYDVKNTNCSSMQSFPYKYLAHCLFVCLFIEWKKSHLVYNKICNVSLSWYSFQVKMHLCQVSSFVIDADLDGTDYVSTHFVILCFNRFTQSSYAKNGTKYMTCNQVSDYQMLSSNICLWIFFYYILDPVWDSFCL